jgi:hypothetical protein
MSDPRERGGAEDSNDRSGPERAGSSLVVSGFAEAGASGGGVFLVGSDQVEAVNARPTTGLSFDEASGVWLRATTAREHSSLASEIFEYSGPPSRVKLRRLATVVDAHDVRSVARRRLVIATQMNAVLELARFRVRTVHTLPGEPDSWHLNCLTEVDGELFASVFRRGGRFGQWSENPLGSGCVFSLTTGTIVADGLSMPHTPRFIDENWVVCDSRQQELVAIDPKRPAERVHALHLGGYTRGLAFDHEHLYVGISARRHQGATSTSAALAVVDRSTWKLVDRIPIPCPEIYDVVLVPDWAPSMLAKPLPPARTTFDRQLSHAVSPPGSTAKSDGIPAGLSVRFAPVKSLEPGVVVSIPTRVEHTGTEPLAISDDKPLHLSYRWIGPDGDTPVTIDREEPLRTSLPPLLPGSSTDIDVMVRAPVVPARYRLRIVFVHEHIRWVDREEPKAFAQTVVEVR